MPSYLISISCRPASVGAYLTVTVPSLLSVMSGLATLPDGIRTSPEAEDNTMTHTMTHTHITMIKLRVYKGDVTCDLSFLDGEWNHQVKRSQTCHIQPVHSHWSVCCLRDRVHQSDHRLLRDCGNRSGYSDNMSHKVNTVRDGRGKLQQ